MDANIRNIGNYIELFDEDMKEGNAWVQALGLCAYNFSCIQLPEKRLTLQLERLTYQQIARIVLPLLSAAEFQQEQADTEGLDSFGSRCQTVWTI